ncbi:predicted protein [Naegleria gruberi]|uniref:Predicted protein n=1 Tax=Naegleria gruberi TaxID=5762 RepID=D2V726_NAEGR|nr:uncharacterized protein NAEGRDRAFT_64646 [Naegleria gruberi]EFC47297.1 predicted protein [Naegleria gruberi]|eukprot:XP_002680041.1 predicted protein [Naegleria gruberi strain NEG-M]
MSGKKDLQTELSPNDYKVFQGLQKKWRCKLCEQEFYVESLPGAISYNSVLKLRSSWGMKIKPVSPALLYQKVHVCVFCLQFFEFQLEKEEKDLKKGPKPASSASMKK